MLEGLVFSEIWKLTGQSPNPVSMAHYRDRDRIEVDLVRESAGRVAGIEVKAAATVNTGDFAGLKRLQDAVGKAFACGIVLHDGDRIQRAGDRRFAMPFNQLWA